MDSLDIDQVKEMMDTKDVTIVDIRDPESYMESHLANAINVGEDEIEEFVNQTDKEKPLICYCYKGFSSQQAVAYFKEKGFKNVYNMTGGFDAWDGTYPTEN